MPASLHFLAYFVSCQRSDITQTLVCYLKWDSGMPKYFPTSQQKELIALLKGCYRAEYLTAIRIYYFLTAFFFNLTGC